MSRVNIYCLMILKEDDFQAEITFLLLPPLSTFNNKINY